MENNIELRPSTQKDLETLFLFQLDKEANHLAAFTAEDPTDKEAYIKKWTRLLSDKTVNIFSIFSKQQLVGSIAKYEIEGEAEVTYWISKSSWGNRIATNALKEFLILETSRPIFGRVAFDNFGSIKVLENCGFLKIGKDTGFAPARGKEIEEFIFKLN